MKLLACCLAVGHGWASATCLIVYRTYASIMTGNVLSLATDCIAAIPIWTDQINEFSPMRGMLTSHYYRQQCAVHGSVFSSYCFGIAVYRVLNTLLGRRASASAIAVGTSWVRSAGDSGAARRPSPMPHLRQQWPSPTTRLQGQQAPRTRGLVSHERLVAAL